MSRNWISAVAIAFAVALGLGGAGLAAAQEYVPAPCDVVTGGGTLVDDDGDLVHLTAEVGCRNGTLVGQVEYRDPRDRIEFRSLAITAWLTDPKRPWLRDACGIGRIAGVDEPVVFRARLIDNFEPGRLDQAGIAIETYRLQTRELRNPGGGNLQLHPADGSVLPPVDVDFVCGDVLAP